MDAATNGRALRELNMSQSTGEVTAKSGKPRVTSYRWLICVLPFAATGLTYIDRQTIAFLKGDLQGAYHWSEANYSSIVMGFMIAYAIGYAVFGKIIDKIGTKRGYALAVIIWTLAHLSCAVVGFLPPQLILASFIVTQALLGLGQSGNFPGAIKAVAEWFPQRERALANGVFNAGSNVGAILTPLIVPAVLAWVATVGGVFMGLLGWQWAFVVTGALSAFWLVAWFAIYQKPGEHPKVSKAELEYIESDKIVVTKSLPWSKVLFVKETWAFSIAKMLTDPVWFFYLFWLPDFLKKTYYPDMPGMSKAAAPVIVIYLISDVGSVAGGWMSSAMIKAGMTVNRSRKLTMLICALCVVPVGFATMLFHDMWSVTLVIGVAAAAHQAFSANLYTVPSDTFPKAAVGTVTGIGGTMGAIGGIIMAWGVAQALAGLGGYSAVFFVAGIIYLVALLILHLLTPRLAPARIKGFTD
jgi:MFS transporter, ACS family, hexuronate transporter